MADLSGRVLRYTGGSGTGATPAQAAIISSNAAAITKIADPVGTAKNSGDVVWGEDRIWVANKTTNVPDPATDVEFGASADWEPLEGSATVDEIVYSNGALAGAADVGEKTGFDVSVSPWKEYYSDGLGAAWALRPVETTPAPQVSPFALGTFHDPMPDAQIGDILESNRREFIWTADGWKPLTVRSNANRYYEGYPYTTGQFATIPSQADPSLFEWAEVIADHTSVEAVDYTKWNILGPAVSQETTLCVNMVTGIIYHLDCVNLQKGCAFYSFNQSDTSNTFNRLPSHSGATNYDLNTGKVITDLVVTVPPRGVHLLMRVGNHYVSGIINPEGTGVGIEEYEAGRVITATEASSPSGAKFTVTDTTDPNNPSARIFKVLRAFTLPATFDENEDDGSGKVYAPADPNDIVPDFLALTIPQITGAAGSPDGDVTGLTSRDLLDAWGVSRRVQRIFNVGGAFDFTGLGYADRTAIFVRNTDRVNGIPVTYGAGGAITREIVNASGLAQSVAGQDSFMIEPGEFIVMEKDGNTVHVSVLPAERVSYFDDYADAATNAVNRVTYDGFALIRDTGEMYGRKTTVNSVAFPADGKPNDDWFRVGDAQPDPQSLILDNIEVTLFSNGTNASSSVGITFVDKDGNNYPASAWAYSANLVQHAGGTDTIITDKAPFSGTIGIGRNKQGPVKFYYVGDNPNGLSAINTVDANNGTTQGVVVTYQGTNYNDAFANVGAVAAGEPLYWTTNQEVTASDQAAPLIDATEYLAGTIFSNPEPDNTDPDYQTWFNWRVNDGETIADTDVPTGTEAEFLAIKGKLTRFGVGSQPSISLGYLAPVDRVVSAPDPIPSTGGAFERVLYQGNTTSDIWVMDNAGANPVKVTNPSAADWANGVRVDDLATGDTYQYDRGTNKFVLLPLIAGELPIVRYTADGAIQDIDHRAIFETGAVNMTLSTSTIDRVIQMVSEGPTTVITANGAEQFTGSLGTSTDSKLTLNDTFKWATIIGRTGGGWSQYVGQVGIPDGVDIATPTMLKGGTRLVQNGIDDASGAIFPEAFKVGTTPTMKIIAQAAGDNVNVTLQTVTNTGFTTWVVRNESDVGIGSPTIHWEATGEPA